MKNGKQRFVDTLMTKDDLRIGTNQILKELEKITRILKKQHRRYHKNGDEVCVRKQNNSLPTYPNVVVDLSKQICDDVNHE